MRLKSMPAAECPTLQVYAISKEAAELPIRLAQQGSRMLREVGDDKPGPSTPDGKQ
jgi:hypothetical protein